MRDIRKIAESVPNLDLDYLRRWAASLGVQERLEKVRG